MVDMISNFIHFLEGVFFLSHFFNTMRNAIAQRVWMSIEDKQIDNMLFCDETEKIFYACKKAYFVPFPFFNRLRAEVRV